MTIKIFAALFFFFRDDKSTKEHAREADIWQVHIRLIIFTGPNKWGLAWGLGPIAGVASY